MKKSSWVFLGSKEIGWFCLNYLLERKDELNIELLGVMGRESKLDSEQSVLALARQNEVAVFKNLDDVPECDFILSVQYHEILKKRHIEKAQKLAINLHMAPLPEYRGSNQFSYAIIDQKKEFGTTLHILSEGVDDGDLLFEKRFPIADDIWIEDLYSLTLEASKQLFQESLVPILKGTYEAVTQSSLEKERGTSFHYRKEIENLKHIRSEWSQEQKDRHIRATSMPGFEMPYEIVDGTKKHFKRN